MDQLAIGQAWSGCGGDLTFTAASRLARALVMSRRRGARVVTVERRSTIDDYLALARANLDRVAPENLQAEVHGGAIVIDIRPTEQRQRDGTLPGAVVVDRNVLEWRLDPTSPYRLPLASDANIRYVLVCNEGYSSSLGAATLRQLGLRRATDLVGGYQAWATTATCQPPKAAGC